MTCDGHAAWFDWVLKLAVATARFCQKPAILLQLANDLSYF
jgi:hypothetical protein